MMKLDMSKVKYLKSSDGKTHLQHKDGHEIILAHKGLGKEFRAQLEALAKTQPKDEQPAKYADGTDDHPVSQDDTQDQPAAPKGVNININTAPQGGDYRGHYADNTVPQAPVTPADTAASKEPLLGVGTALPGAPPALPGVGAPMNQPPQNPADAATPQVAPPLQAAQTPPDSTPQDPTGQQAAAQPQAAKTQTDAFPSVGQEAFIPQTPQQDYLHTKTSLLNEANAWSQDLSNGTITPKTYKSLFANESTLDQIGTVFGLLLGGIGSGLTGQPNAALMKMNKIIENDLDAQKATVSNKMNFLKLNQAQQMQDAEIKKMVQDGHLTEAQAANIRQDATQKRYTLARMQAERTALHDLVLKVQRLPEGSKEQVDAKNALALLQQTTNTSNNDLADRAAAASSVLNFGPGSGQGPEADFAQRQKGLLLGGQKGLADQESARHIPGFQGQATRDIPEASRQQIQAMGILDDKGKDVLNYVQQHKGTWNPQTRAVAEQKIEEMKNFYNDSIKGGALTQGRLGWYDEQFAKHPTDILAQLMGSSAKLKEMVDSNAKRRDTVVKSLGDFKSSAPAQPSQGDIIERKAPDGRTALFRALSDGSKKHIGYKGDK